MATSRSVPSSNDILLVDDDIKTLKALERLLTTEHYTVSTAGCAEDALVSINDNPPAIVLLDLGLPDANGVDLVRALLSKGVRHVIIISGTNSAETTRQCLREGAFDYLLKPVRKDELLQAVRRATSSYHVRHVRKQEYPIELTPGFGALETPSAKSQEMFNQLRQMSVKPAVNTLIIGAAGLFKRDIAALLHHYTRRPGPALLINCALETDIKAPSRFIGDPTAVDKLARTGYLERASHGTLVLDDLSLLPDSVQEVLVEHMKQKSDLHANQPPCNVIGILKEPLEHALSSGRLTSTLHETLARNLIKVPALRERPEDVRVFASQAISQLNDLFSSEKSLSNDFLDFLSEQSWDGNLIELKNRLLTAYRGTEDGEEIVQDPVHRPPVLRNDAPSHTTQSAITPLVGLTLAEAETRLLKATLASVGNNKSKASRILGISVKTLYNRMKA